MRFGVAASILLHACLIGFAFVSLPSFLRTKIIEAPVVPIELISEAELAKETSVPAAAPKPKPEEKKPEPEEKPAPQPKAEEKAPEPEPAPLPEPKKEEPKKEEPKPEAKKEEPKPPVEKPKPTPKPKPKNDDLDLDALSALVDKAKKEAPSGEVADAVEEADQPRARIGTGDRLTASEIDKMRAAISRCWNAGAIIGAPNPEKLIVVIDIDLNRDGSLKGDPRVVNALEISLSGNRFWQVAQQNAVRAVIACQPYDFFDQTRYNEWSAFSLHFDPSQMAGF
ncbi:MAG: hypothetical protein R3C60_06685 [Parvularculaceae bacterium]